MDIEIKYPIERTSSISEIRKDIEDIKTDNGSFNMQHIAGYLEALIDKIEEKEKDLLSLCSQD